MRVVIATHNRKKAGEMLTILSQHLPTFEFVTLADFPGAPDPEETGATYEENALIKARAAAEFTGCLSLADDAGLEIDAMDGEPGVYSKRFAGENTPFPEKMQIILERMQGVRRELRSARFRCFVAAAWRERPTQSINTKVFEATYEGLIADSPAGAGGFGYDPIFYLPSLGCTMAELAPEQKNAVSHRGMVLKAVSEWLATFQRSHEQ